MASKTSQKLACYDHQVSEKDKKLGKQISVSVDTGHLVEDAIKNKFFRWDFSVLLSGADGTTESGVENKGKK